MNRPKKPTGLLSGVRVVEMAQRVSGPYCDRPHPEKSGLFLALNDGK